MITQLSYACVRLPSSLAFVPVSCPLPRRTGRPSRDCARPCGLVRLPATAAWATVGPRAEIRREKTRAVKSGRPGFQLQLCHRFRQNHPDFRTGIGARRFKAEWCGPSQLLRKGQMPVPALSRTSRDEKPAAAGCWQPQLRGHNVGGPTQVPPVLTHWPKIHRRLWS